MSGLCHALDMTREVDNRACVKEFLSKCIKLIFLLFMGLGTENVQATQKYITSFDARRLAKLPEHRMCLPPVHYQSTKSEAASSLNSAYCYILQSDSTVFTWSGNLTSTVDQELMERMLDLIKPNLQTKSHKEGYESEQFWELLGGKTEYASNKIAKEAETEPHLFACSFSNEDLKVTEIYSFTQDDLMTEDIFILSCHTELFVWIGKQVDTKNRTHALAIGEKFVELDFLLEKISLEAPVYVIMEGSEP
ncbi:hypothetical protein ACFE04_005781 [Oxalis oulophora]